MARIVTLTLNPAVDVAWTAPTIRPTEKIRVSGERIDAGGGGINVARVLRVLGEDPVALIATGGATGRLIEELLDEANVHWRSVKLNGRTRISVNVHDAANELEYRFVPEGPMVQPAELLRLRDAVRNANADWIVASGSLPPGVPVDFYADLARLTARRGHHFVLDTSGEPLHASVGHGIALLKLSRSECESLIGRSLNDLDSQLDAIATLQQSGAATRLAVSFGKEGAILASDEGVFHCPGLPVKARGTVGAGDSFLAGLVRGLAHGLSDRDALAHGVATASAAVSRYGTAVVSMEDVETLLTRINCTTERSHS